MAAQQLRKNRANAKADEFDPASETLDDDYVAFHKRAKQMPEAKRRTIEAKFQAAFAKRREATQRLMNNIFSFWCVCPEKACKRTSRCAGDAYACFERWWPVTPERCKVEFRAYIKASCSGLSPQDALREAAAEIERAAEHIARVDAQTLAKLEKRDAAMAAQQEEPRTEAPLPASRISSAQPPSPRSAGRGEARTPRVRAL